MKKYVSSFITISTLFALSACHPERSLQGTVQSEANVGIINGKPVEKTHPSYWMTARILSKVDGVWYPVCTASVVAKDLILTAAHCVEGSPAEDIRIAFDAQPLSYEDQQSSDKRVDVVAQFKTIGVKNLIAHPEYGQSDYDHDIALIHLESEIPQEFKPVPFLNEEQMKAIKEGQTYQVLLVGFGLISENPFTGSAVLRETTVPARFEGLHLITDQTGGSGGCNGDSGGPAYLELEGTLYLVGVTHGPTVGVYDCKHEGVWGNPNFDKEFLNQSAQELGSEARF